MSLHLRFKAGAELFGIFFFELVKANLKVAGEVLSPKMKITPGMIEIPLILKTDFQITLLSHLITLTPGTLSVELSEDQKTLMVHSLYSKNKKQEIQDIKTKFEARIHKTFEGAKK